MSLCLWSDRLFVICAIGRNAIFRFKKRVTNRHQPLSHTLYTFLDLELFIYTNIQLFNFNENGNGQFISRFKCREVTVHVCLNRSPTSMITDVMCCVCGRTVSVKPLRHFLYFSKVTIIHINILRYNCCVCLCKLCYLNNMMPTL